MIARAARIGLFRATWALFGLRRARRLSAKWREALADPDLTADLAMLGYLSEAHVAPDGSALPGREAARRDGARQLALALFARAEITMDDISQAIEETEHEPVDDDEPDLFDERPERPGR